jgi:TolB protein
MAHDGAHLQALTDRRASDGGASWHPRADAVAFVSYGEGDGNGDIYTIRADGSGERQLTWHPETDNWPRWSPDGTQILFSSRRDGANALFIMDLDGAIVRKVTDERFTVQGADWFDPDAPRTVSPLGRYATTWGWLKRLGSPAR